MLCTYSEHRYCHRNVRCQFRYGNPENYSTGTVIVTKDVSTSMVIKKNNSTSTVIVTSVVSTGMAIQNMTVPVLSLRRLKSMPVWSSPTISLPVMILILITSLKNLHYRYCTSYFGAIPVKYICGYGDPAFAALVPITYLLKITLPVWVALPVP
jgi:hypothetical protein